MATFFLYLPGLTRNDIPWSLQRVRVQAARIEARAFENDGMDDVEVDEDKYDSLRRVELAPSVAVIGASAFYLCVNLERVEIVNGVDQEASQESELEQIQDHAFAFCYSLREMTLPASLRSLGGGCFRECTALTDVTFLAASLDMDHHQRQRRPPVPPSASAKSSTASASPAVSYSQLESLGDSCFDGCTSLTRIDLSHCWHLVELPSAVFSSCTALVHILLPPRLQTIGDNAFAACRSLQTIYFPSTLRAIGDSAFWHCIQLGVVRFESMRALQAEGHNEDGIQNSAFEDCGALHQVILPHHYENDGNHNGLETRKLGKEQWPDLLPRLFGCDGGDIDHGGARRTLSGHGRATSGFYL